MNLKRLYGKFTKFTKQTDGTLIVEGVASSESQDSDGEVIKASAISAALPGFMKFANVREMHQPIAAGKALDVVVGADNVTKITAHIVDAGSVLKVESGVLQGFSIGGTIPAGGRSKDNPKVIESIELVEISLVDRPANPDAVITLVKVEGAKQVLGADPAVVVFDPVAKVEAVKKGMYTVAWAAELCQSLANLGADTQWEADYEGDKSPIPARIKALLAEFAAILRDLVAEETAELVGTGTAEVDAVAMVNKPGALKKSEKFAAFAKQVLVEKKGAKFSTKTKKTLEDIHGAIDKCHGMLKEASEGMHSIGYKEAEEVTEDAQRSGDLQKLAAETTRADTAEKRAGEAETAGAAAGETLKKLSAERDELKKQLDAAQVELKKKGALKAVPVAKEDDAKGAIKVEVVAPPEGTPERALFEMKKVHAGGGVHPLALTPHGAPTKET